MKTGQSYSGKYKGIVIQNNDPENMGRVKVYVPHVSMTLYKDWNDDLDADKFFKFPGSNLQSKLEPNILKRLKESLPWGEVEQPIFGMNGTGYYWSETDHGTTEQSAVIEPPNVPPVEEEEPAVEEEAPAPQKETAKVADTGNKTQPQTQGAPSEQHGPAEKKEVHATFYHADEAVGDPFSKQGKTVHNSPDYFANREGGTKTGSFRDGGIDVVGNVAVDPNKIPYGSYVDIADSNGFTRRYVAADTGSAVVARTAARANGSNAPVVDIHLPTKEWNKTHAAGNQTVIVYPYKGPTWSKLPSATKETFYANTIKNLKLNPTSVDPRTITEDFQEITVASTRNGTRTVRATSKGQTETFTLPDGTRSPSRDAGDNSGPSSALFPSNDPLTSAFASGPTNAETATGVTEARKEPIKPPEFPNLEGDDDIRSSEGNANSKSENGVEALSTGTENGTRLGHESGEFNNDKNKIKGGNTRIANTNPVMRSIKGNLPNGFISIPEVGSHVWVRFEGGHPLSPVVEGAVAIGREAHLLNSGQSNT